MAITATDRLIGWLKEHDDLCPPVGRDADQKTKDLQFGRRAAALVLQGKLTADKLAELTSEEANMPTATEIFSGRKDAGEGRVRVKGADESYSTKRVTGTHAKTGKPVENPFTGRPAEHNSELDNARAGVLLKHLAQRSGQFPSVGLKEYEFDLLADMAENEAWAGDLDGEYREKIRDPGRVKSLLDDSLSGGIEITPTFFDDQVVTIPLLRGELLPRVDARPMDRGRRVEGAQVSTPSISWGQYDAQEVSLFDTADLITPLDSTVFGAAVALEVGRDFLSDTPVNVGNLLTQLIGEAMQAELDRVIADGNGTTQPEGILRASGMNAVNTDEGASGPPSLNDYISLLFAIGKQYRNQAMRPAFLSNDTTFQRSRAIAVDAANTPPEDQRPVMAPLTQINEYSTLGWDHAIQNDIGNRTCVYGAMSKYRLWRRAGMSVQWTDGGAYLARRNLSLLVVRARYAGRVVDPNAFALWTDGQT